VSPAVRAQAADRGLEVIDATCPLVTWAHVEARRFATRGDTVILIGHAGHEEVEGTLGEAPDRTILVQGAEKVAELLCHGN
jgi:4-hydroxy-3-methylbut-2-enyl diphosphate reductase